MTRHFLVYFALLLSVTTGCRDFALDSDDQTPATGPRTVEATQEQPFLLRLGDVATLETADVQIEFSQMGEDSRCPSGVECFHPGLATIILTITDSQNVKTQIALSIPGLSRDPRSHGTVSWQGLTYQLLDLSPYPRAGGVIPPESVRALLRVEQVF